jgi:membrane associated rhomboid family serine protease
LAHIGGFLFGLATARIFADPRRIAFRGPTYR